MRSVAIVVMVTVLFAAVLWTHGVRGLHGMMAHLQALHQSSEVTHVPGSGAILSAADTPGRDGWPATHAGDMGRRWVMAFNTGEEAMKECLADVMAGESLEKTAMPARVERYRDLREKLGTLTLVSIDKSERDGIEATLATSDLSQQHFTFNVQPAPPYKLLTVSMTQPHFGMHGFGH